MYTKFTVERLAGDMLKITGHCIVTRKPVERIVSQQAFDAYYVHGALVQYAFPELSREDREFFVSGMSPEGWDKMFGDSNAEDDPD